MTTDDKELRRARALARALDAAVSIPGTRFTIGLDAILGLIPGAGDVAGAALSGYIVLAAVRRGAPPEVIWRMLANVGIDTIFGTLPIVGDVFDVVYRSNIRNVELLERYTIEPAAVTAAVTKGSRRLGVIVVLILVVLLLALGVATFFVARLAWQLLNS